MRATAAEETQSGTLFLLCLAAWAIPGAGHLWLGRRSKGLIFLVALPLMFAIGVGIRGCLFPFQLTDPLVGLAALAAIPTALTLGYEWTTGVMPAHAIRAAAGAAIGLAVAWLVVAAAENQVN